MYHVSQHKVEELKEGIRQRDELIEVGGRLRIVLDVDHLSDNYFHYEGLLEVW